MKCKQRSCPHVSGYFWKRSFFSPVFEKIRVHRSVFKSFLPVHMCPDIFENGGFFSIFEKICIPFQIVFVCPRHLTSSFSKTSAFLCPHGSKKYSVKKIYTLETIFKKLRFRLPETPFACRQKPYPERKSFIFKNIWIRVECTQSSLDSCI